MSDPRILFIDIETAPNLVYRFDDLSYPASTPLEFLVQPSRMLSFAAKFYGERTLYRGENIMTHEEMVLSAWEMMNEADVLVTYNGDRFDIPWLNTEIKDLGLPKPSPFRSLDLMAVGKQFKLPSKKLAYVSKRFGWGKGKLESGGIGTWVGILNGDPKAWKQLQKYNIGDVDVLVDGFESLRNWLPSWFNMNPYMRTENACPKCGVGGNLVKEGFSYTATGAYQKYHCKVCLSWSTDTRRAFGAKKK